MWYEIKDRWNGSVLSYYWPENREQMRHLLNGLRRGWGSDQPSVYNSKFQRPEWGDETEEFRTLWDFDPFAQPRFRFIGWLWGSGMQGYQLEKVLVHGSMIASGGSKYAVIAPSGQEMTLSNLPAIV